MNKFLFDQKLKELLELLSRSWNETLQIITGKQENCAFSFPSLGYVHDQIKLFKGVNSLSDQEARETLVYLKSNFSNLVTILEDERDKLGEYGTIKPDNNQDGYWVDMHDLAERGYQTASTVVLYLEEELRTSGAFNSQTNTGNKKRKNIEPGKSIEIAKQHLPSSKNLKVAIVTPSESLWNRELLVREILKDVKALVDCFIKSEDGKYYCIEKDFEPLFTLAELQSWIDNFFMKHELSKEEKLHYLKVLHTTLTQEAAVIDALPTVLEKRLGLKHLEYSFTINNAVRYCIAEGHKWEPSEGKSLMDINKGANIKEQSKKEIKLDALEKIRLDLNQTQICYLFKLLINEKVINENLNPKLWSLVSQYFSDQDNKPLKNIHQTKDKSLNTKTGKPSKKSDLLEGIAKKAKGL